MGGCPRVDIQMLPGYAFYPTLFSPALPPTYVTESARPQLSYISQQTNRIFLRSAVSPLIIRRFSHFHLFFVDVCYCGHLLSCRQTVFPGLSYSCCSLFLYCNHNNGVCEQYG